MRRFLQIAGSALMALAGAWAAEPPPGTGDFVECTMKQRVAVRFPARALAEGVLRGEVVLLLDVDRTGQLADLLVVACTRAEFARSATDAVKQWEFTPGRIAGEGIGARITLVIEFEVTGVSVHVQPPGTDALEGIFDERFDYRPVTVEQLDRVPAARVRTAPIYPREWIVQGRAGEVTVDFFIDEEGRVRFASVLGTSDGLLGAAAVMAVREWRFDPPTVKGRPVLVRAQQEFHFQLPTQAAKG